MSPIRFALLEALCPKLFEAAESLECLKDQWGRFIGCESTTGKRFTSKSIWKAIDDGVITEDLVITIDGQLAYQDAIRKPHQTDNRQYSTDELRRVRLEWRSGSRGCPNR